MVDGYNALHCAPFRQPLDRSLALGGAPLETAAAALPRPFWSQSMRERLVAFAGRFASPEAEIWLVFDGAHAPEKAERGDHPGLRVHFAPSADDWIVERVRGDADPSRIAVVSGDRRLGGRSQHLGAAVVSPRRFLDHCGALAAISSD